MEYVDQQSQMEEDGQQQNMILCCTCGVAIEPNPCNMCVACLRGKVDITEGIPKQCVIYWCKGCHRYLQKTGVWVSAQLESPELLALCLKKLKNLNKVRLVDASFIWTEPHSKRVKVRLVVQGSTAQTGGAILQQEFTVEYQVQNYMCDACHRVEAKDYWQAVVQVRQKEVRHKKTFYYLEQCIIKHRAHNNTLSIKEVADGIDFYFATKQDARKLVEFISTAVPCRSKTSEKLISHDTHSNTYNYKHTFSVELVPVCRDQVVCLPARLSRQLANVGQVCVCYRLSSILHLIDPNTCQVVEVQSSIFWRSPFRSLCSVKQLTEFTVLQVEVVQQGDRHHRGGAHSNKHELADVWVVRSSELGQAADRQVYTRTHLGRIINPGDTVLGFDVSNSNVNDVNVSAMSADKLPDVVLVKKVYGERGKRERRRAWKLRRFVSRKGAGGGAEGDQEGGGALLQDGSESGQAAQDDYIDFLEEIEEDVEMRQNIDIYKDPSKVAAAAGSGGEGPQPPVEVDDDELEEVPQISLQEMLDDLNIND